MADQQPRRRMDPEERRAEILEAGAELFALRAYSAVSVADIARAAGSSPSLVIVYFGSKQALYLEVLSRSADELRAGLLDAAGEPSPERLRAIIEWYAEYALSHRNGFLSLLRGEHEAVLPEAGAIIESLRADITAGTLANLRAQGLSSIAAHPAAEIAVRGYLGYVDAMVVRWLSDSRGVGAGTIADLGVAAYTNALAVLYTPPPS